MGTVVGLAVLIAAVAVLDAGVGLVGRMQSARIGEGLILDLRRTVYDHVQSCRSPSSPGPVRAPW